MDKTFDEFISNSKKRLVKNFLLAVVVFIAYSFKIFKKEGGVFDNTYILSELLCIVIFAGIYIYQIISISKTINNTAEEVSFEDNLTIIKTYPFQFFSFINKETQTITINTHKVFVKKAQYPVSGASNESILVFAVNNIDIFIILNSLPADFTAIFLDQKKASETLG